MTYRIFFKGLALTLLTMVLAACGSGGGDGGGLIGGGGVQDAFIAEVRAVIAASLDTAEPREIDSLTATSPESTEPEALDS